MSEHVHITGMGIISAIGDTVEETFRSLSGCVSGISKIEYLKTKHRDKFVAGEVKHGNEELIKIAVAGEHDRTTLLGLIAAKEALRNSGIRDIKESRTGFISATTVAGMCRSELVYADFFEKKTNENFIDAHFAGYGTDAIARVLGIDDYVTTISTACSSSANAIMLGARLIKNNLLDRVIVGGTDALSKFTFNGFNTLMILDPEWCKPFDGLRKGLNLGEGAAYLVLESEAEVHKFQKKSLARISGYGNANDAYHQTASSPEGNGALLAMHAALKVAQLDHRKIDYINAHGTGTPNNDSSEGVAMQRLFGESVPKFSSTKAYTGHTLAASAAIEAVISLLSLENTLIFPCLNRTVQMEDISITPVSALEREQGMNYVMSNSFGFGGNCSSLIFGKN